MKKYILVCFAIGLFLAVTSAAMAGTIVGSAHDMTSARSSKYATPGEGRICVYCHTPHHAARSSDIETLANNSNVHYFPLWNHDMTIQSYLTYTNTDATMELPGNLSHQLNATLGQPGGPSRLCLSCHDGSVAVNAYGHYDSNPTNYAGAATIDAGYQIGGLAGLNYDLSNHHPIGFDYDAIAQTLDDELYTSDTPINGGSGLLISDLLWNHSIECTSCHDVHNTKAEGEKFLYVNDNLGSALCLSCHMK